MPTADDIIVNIHAAKTNLSRLIQNMESDGKTITIARAGKPVARIVPCPPAKAKRQPGILKGVSFPDAAFAPLSATELQQWYQ